MPVFERSITGKTHVPGARYARPSGWSLPVGRCPARSGGFSSRVQRAGRLRTRFTAAKEMPMPATEPEHYWTVALRRKQAGPGISNLHDPGSSTYEIICRICGDDPALDHLQISAELQQLRGPYTLSDGITAFTRHNEVHNGTGEMPPGRTRGSCSDD